MEVFWKAGYLLTELLMKSLFKWIYLPDNHEEKGKYGQDDVEVELKESDTELPQ